MRLSIITVSLNSGDRLLKTVQSSASQSFRDYELIVKDAGSADGSVERLESWLGGEADRAFPGTDMAARVRIFREKDSCIYDGMNRGAALARGEYLYFLNCGDTFHGADALERFMAGMTGTAADMETDPVEAEHMETIKEGRPADESCPDGGMEQSLLYYGNVYDMLRGSVVQSNPRMDAFACYRHVPNHQACVYHRSLFAERGYRTKYRVRADYEHFLWCFFEKKVSPRYVPVTLADYEGGGFSETSANKKRSAAEHKEITALYMPVWQRFCYRAALMLTLQPVRTALADNAATAKVYQKLKNLIYRR
ncbi:MAG: glycosyltransferase [Lachnospiraceae bacterium]|nr:glycosyltransferase [Lachnospiraceae bacterium]